MKRIFASLMAGLMLLCSVACTEPAKETAADNSFTDDLGRTVTVASHDRTAALLGSYADVWFLAGGTVCASPDDAWDDLHLPMPEDAVNLGATKKMSLEALLGAKPDFVIASANSSQHVEWKDTLEDAGIPVAYFDVSCFEDYLRMLKICTDLTGKPENYEKYGTAQKERVDAAIAAAKDKTPRKTLVLRASAGSVRAKASAKNILGEMVVDLGSKNIADSDKTLLETLSAEAILLENPEMLLIAPTGDDLEGIKKNVETLFEENPLWKELDAVKNGQVYYMEKQLFQMKPNARWAEAYETLAEILYGKN